MNRNVWIGIGVITLINIVVLLINFLISPITQPPPEPIMVTNALGTPRILLPTDTPAPTITPIPMVELVIAVQQIPRGFTIPPNAVTTRIWPEISAPASGIFNLESVIGKKARTDIFREQPILTNMLVDDLANLASVGSDLSSVLPSNRVAFTLHIDPYAMTDGIQPGDRVDVIYSFDFIDIDEIFQSQQPNVVSLITGTGSNTDILINEPGRLELLPPLGELFSSPSESQRPRTASQRTIQDALVVWTGFVPIGGRMFFAVPSPTPVPTVGPNGNQPQAFGTSAPTPVPPPAYQFDRYPITLAVSPQDAVVMAWAEQQGLPVKIILRAATSTSQEPSNTVTLDYMLSTFNVEIPGNRSYTVNTAQSITVP